MGTSGSSPSQIHDRSTDDAHVDLDECPICFLVTILFPIFPIYSST